MRQLSFYVFCALALASFTSSASFASNSSDLVIARGPGGNGGGGHGGGHGGGNGGGNGGGHGGGHGHDGGHGGHGHGGGGCWGIFCN